MWGYIGFLPALIGLFPRAGKEGGCRRGFEIEKIFDIKAAGSQEGTGGEGEKECQPSPPPPMQIILIMARQRTRRA